MARQCAICGKKSIMVWRRKKLRGKYNPTVKKRKHPNLQWAHLASGLPASATPKALQAGKRVKACTKCIKTMGKGK